MSDMDMLRQWLEERIKECKQQQEGERWYGQVYAEAAGKIAVYHEVLARLESMAPVKS